MAANLTAETNPRSWKTVIAVILVALTCRAAAVWQLYPSLSEDVDGYRRLAQGLVEGRGLTDSKTGLPTAYRPPFYPFVLAAIFFCHGSNFAIGVVQALIGCATVGLTIDLGARLRMPRGGIFAGLLVAVDPILLFQTAQVMTETTATFLAVCSLWLCATKPTWWSSLILGLVFGAACLCRPTFWVFGLLGGISWLIDRVRVLIAKGWHDDSETRLAVLTFAGILLLVGPWVHRNHKWLRQPVFTTTHGGYTLLMAHNPSYAEAARTKPWETIWKDADFVQWGAEIELEMAGLRPPLDRQHLSPRVELARDDWMNRKGWSHVYQDKKSTLVIGFSLLSRMWSITPAPVNNDRSDKIRLGIGIFYLTVTVLFLVGVVRVVRARHPDWWLPLALIIAFTGVHTFYWADMRMRAPLIPAIALLAAAALFRVEPKIVENEGA